MRPKAASPERVLVSAVNIVHHVARLKSPNLNDCWATALAVIMGRHSIDGVNHVKSLARSAGVQLRPNGSLDPQSITALAGAVHLYRHDTRNIRLTVPLFARLLARRAVAAFGEFDYPGSVFQTESMQHAVALYRLVGSGIDEGTTISVMDPADGTIHDFKFKRFVDDVADIEFVLSLSR